MSLRQQFVDALRGVERGAWVRFLIALLGLALAFASALLSTASGEAGDALATAVFASSALLLAGVVAVSTVPYLARRVVGRRVRDALSYEVTREGIVYLLLTLLIGVAALNTGNNLLFIVVAAMLAAVLVSGIVSALMISGLETELHLPHHVFAGQSYAGAVLLHNRRWLPAFSISVVPPSHRKRTARCGAGSALNSFIRRRARGARQSSDGQTLRTRNSIRRVSCRPFLSRVCICPIFLGAIVRAQS